MILELIKKTRTHRHFKNEEVLEKDILKFIDSARYSPSAKNSQILKFSYTNDDDKCKQIFNNIALGSALKKDDKPSINERPRAAILIVINNKDTSNDNNSIYFNMGLATQNIILTASENNIDACIVMAYNKKEIEKIFNIPEEYTSKLLIIFGKGKENVKIIDVDDNSQTKYFREDSTHYVPKIKLKNLILK